MDVVRDSNVYDFEAHRKLDAGRRASRTTPGSGEKPVIAAAWYHGNAIEADRGGGAEMRNETFNVIPLRH